MSFQNPTETSYIRSLIFLLSYPDVKHICTLNFTVIVLKHHNKTGCFRHYWATSHPHPPPPVREPGRFLKFPPLWLLIVPQIMTPSKGHLCRAAGVQGPVCSGTRVRLQSIAAFVSPFSQGIHHKNGPYPVRPHVPTSGPSLRNGSVLWFYSYWVGVIYLVKLSASDYVTLTSWLLSLP